jgi:hypothetical protein
MLEEAVFSSSSLISPSSLSAAKSTFARGTPIVVETESFLDISGVLKLLMAEGPGIERPGEADDEPAWFRSIFSSVSLGR